MLQLVSCHFGCAGSFGVGAGVVGAGAGAGALPPVLPWAGLTGVVAGVVVVATGTVGCLFPPFVAFGCLSPEGDVFGFAGGAGFRFSQNKVSPGFMTVLSGIVFEKSYSAYGG